MQYTNSVHQFVSLEAVTKCQKAKLNWSYFKSNLYCTKLMIFIQNVNTAFWLLQWKNCWFFMLQPLSHLYYRWKQGHPRDTWNPLPGSHLQSGCLSVGPGLKYPFAGNLQIRTFEWEDCWLWGLWIWDFINLWAVSIYILRKCLTVSKCDS